MIATEIPVNDIQKKEYFAVVSRIISEYPLDRPSLWSSFYRLYTTEEDADLYILEQKKFNGKPWYGKSEYKKFSIFLPI